MARPAQSVMVVAYLRGETVESTFWMISTSTFWLILPIIEKRLRRLNPAPVRERISGLIGVAARRLHCEPWPARPRLKQLRRPARAEYSATGVRRRSGVTRRRSNAQS
jgi:hypothetical protein